VKLLSFGHRAVSSPPFFFSLLGANIFWSPIAGFFSPLSPFPGFLVAQRAALPPPSHQRPSRVNKLDTLFFCLFPFFFRHQPVFFGMLFRPFPSPLFSGSPGFAIFVITQFLPFFLFAGGWFSLPSHGFVRTSFSFPLQGRRP